MRTRVPLAGDPHVTISKRHFLKPNAYSYDKSFLALEKTNKFHTKH